MFWQIGIGAASLAVVILVAFLIPAVVESRRAIKETVKSLHHMQGKMDRTAEETLQLVKQTGNLLADLQRKIQTTDAFFVAMEQTGEAAERFSESVKLVSHALSDTVLEARKSLLNQQDTVREVIELAAAGMNLWQKWFARKESKATAQTSEQS
jgi:uncharacterized protein YoxC